ncbi:MAG: hypothetical protein C0616_11605 [Desulfuromonas sp.]|nr:MAG: hypothetical protein C0616_11605 [Desulfuromonas sp.]
MPRILKFMARMGLCSFFLLALAGGGTAAFGLDADQGSSWFSDHVRWSFRNLNFAQIRELNADGLDSRNLLNTSKYTLQAELRPDLAIIYDRMELQVKPRAVYTWEKWEDGRNEGEDDTNSDYFIQEWLARVQPLEGLFLSYGREDLQWGPAYLLSASNPFFSANGSDRPKTEVPGADYGRLIWSPNMAWSLSLMVNTDDGEKELFADFHKTYAMKVDYTLTDGQISLNLAKQESADPRLGAYVSWNFGESFLAYGEGSVAEKDFEVLVGGSYTFLEGAILALEYFYNDSGTRDGDLVEAFFTLQSEDNREAFLRKNYLLLQYFNQDLLGKWNALLRLTYGVDDSSMAILAAGEYNLGSHLQLFANGTYFTGDDDSEFGGLLEYRALCGFELIF